jgi:hypothetical protein
MVGSNFLWRAIAPSMLIYVQGFMVRGYRWIILLIVTQWGWCDALAGTGTKLRLELAEDDRVIDIAKESGLRDLVSLADEMIQRSKAQEAALHESRKKLLNDRTLAELPHAELKQYFSEPKDFISDKDRRGWKELRSLALKALEPNEPALRRHYNWQIQEIAAAICNNHRSPSPPYMDLLQPPLYYMDYAHNPIAKGQRIASNLKPSSVGRDVPIAPHTRPQPSTLNPQLPGDPLPSTFWVRPQAIRERDLYHGFGRTESPPDFESRLWTYAAPKTSYGGCPGFEAQSGSERIKVKFAETTSEPFTARIFWALGYHVEPTDYVHSLKLKYDRRFFREFHMRKDVQMKVRALFIPLHTVNLQQRHDPFDYVFFAVLKNGERISGSDLKHRLLHDPNIGPHASGPENFRAEFEQQIDYLITTPANVQTREADVKSIGPWDFASLDHAQRREVRAAGLLGAWVGWFDSRFENTRLKIVQPSVGRDVPIAPHTGLPLSTLNSHHSTLRHYFTDLGGGLGKSIGVLSRHCECPNDFGWRFTGPAHFASTSDRKLSSPPLATSRRHASGPHASGFRIVDYEPIEDTEAFRQMTIDDARWMARLIAQLTEDQILQALIASGFDAAEVKIYTEKLASRRDWMLRDLGLDAEFAMLRPGGPDLTLTYNPHRERLPEARLKDGTRVAARRSLLVVEDGRVVPDKHTRTPLQRLAADQVPPTRNIVSTTQMNKAED